MKSDNIFERQEAWEAEFYPVPANKVKKRDAIKASLLKWRGLLSKNLRRHGIFYFQVPIEFDDETCALCYHYFDRNYDYWSEDIGPSTDLGPCKKCPLAQMLGKRCDEHGGPYIKFLSNGSPVSMIRALMKLEARHDW